MYYKSKGMKALLCKLALHQYDRLLMNLDYLEICHLIKNQSCPFLNKLFKLPLKTCILLSKYPTLFLTCWSFVKKSSCRASHFLTSCSFFRLLLLSVARWDDDDKKWKGPPKVSTLNMICYKVAATWSFGQKRQSTPHFIFITSILTSIKIKHHANYERNIWP